MKSLMQLWSTLAKELASGCRTSATMDIKYVQERSKCEGFSFLTITLPAFGKDFERSLELEAADRSLFQGFSWRAGLPRFLGGFLDLVFDRNSGELLDTPDIDAILAVRQLSLMFSKILLPCSDTRERRAMLGYIKCEEDVREADRQLSFQDRSDFRRISASLFSSVFSEVDREVYYGEIVPKHGPGATADKLRGNAKYRQTTWTRRLEKILPCGEYLLPNWSFYDQLGATDILEPGAETPVRVVSVPKTLKTPRIIGIEPTAMQYAQQAISESILGALKRSDFLDSASGRRSNFLDRVIGFDDQEPNQLMARRGSLSGDLATLDLSEASDRVSNQLVRDMMRNHPHLHAAVDASRSRKADVPGQGVVRLAKFASMGSALCFPIEAMVFLTIVFIGIERELSSPLDRRDRFRDFVDLVRVYGDDIIVPVEYVQSVVDTLSSFGMKVNVAKSFWNGKFRESCGKEYYDGHDVSIVKVRHNFPTQRKCATEVIGIVNLRNQLYFAGRWETVRWLDEKIREVIRHFPVVLPTSSVLGRHSFLGYESKKIGGPYQVPLVKGYVVKSTIPSDVLDGSGALLKFFLKRGELPSADTKHLERAGRPQSVDIKLGWASAI